jgi:hypothetical protein
MTRVARVSAACAILAAFAAGPCAAAPSAGASFGTALSAYELDALAGHATASGAASLPVPASFATTATLTPTFALDGGYRIDTAQRFGSFEHAFSPLLGNGYLSLADGGRYGGITVVPASDLRLRLGFSNWTGRLDNATFNGVAATGLANVYDPSHVDSLLAGVTWDMNDWVGVGVNAISSTRTGLPANYAAGAPSASTNAVQVSARFNLGNDWVTTADFATGVTELHDRAGATSLGAQSYAITIAKRGVFGDDAVGFSLSRPAPGMVDSFTSLTAPGDLPAMMLNSGKAAPETDFQLGYVTSFLGGKLALQANAAYQLNPQGQTGATAVSVLSRAKIKF